MRLFLWPRSLPMARRGATTVLMALCLTFILAFLAFSVDWGYMVLAESDLQNAADAGALSAARALPNGRSAAITAAQIWSGKNKAAGQDVSLVAAEDVEIGYWDSTTATFTALAANSQTSPNAVRVTCRRKASRGNGLGLFFGPAVGMKTADVSASSIAKLKTSRCGLITGLTSVKMSGSSHTDSYNSSNAAYNKKAAASNGTVCSNGGISMSGSSDIHGDAHPGIGKTVKRSGSAKVSGQTKALTTPLSYPPAEVGDAPTVNKNSKIPLTAKGKQPLNALGEFSLSGNDSVTIPPGTYYFSKFTLSGSSSLTITGPTIIFCTGNFDMSGSSVSNVTQLPQNLQLFPMGSTCNISGSTDLYAVVYAPFTDVISSGSADYYGAIIGAKLTLSGSSGIHADEALDSLFLGGGVQRPILVQ